MEGEDEKGFISFNNIMRGFFDNIIKNSSGWGMTYTISKRT